MFIELNKPKFIIEVKTGKRLWQINTTFQIHNSTRYMTLSGGLVSSPIRYDWLEDVWNAAAKYYADNGKVYPYGYVIGDDGEESVIHLSDTIIEVVRKKMEELKNKEDDSNVMRFE